jgi:predicted RND superfamily exporter protein
MSHDKGSSPGIYEKLSDLLGRHSGRIILAVAVLTLLLIIPLFVMGSEEQASSDPAGEVFDLQADLNERFAPSVHGVPFHIESPSGDVLAQAPLWELYRNERQLREKDQAGELAPEGLEKQSYLFQAFDVDANRPFVGIYSIADAVQEVLVSDPRLDTTLEKATDDQVKLAIGQLFSNPATSGLKGSLSIKARSEKRSIGGTEIDYWVSPGMFLNVLADNERLGGETFQIGMGGGEAVLNKEEFNRNVQRVLRGEQRDYRLWGIAIDVNLEGNDEGNTAGLFLMFTVVGVILVAGLSLRSYWPAALTGVGIGFLMIWLKGISSLVGIKGGLVVDMIVPIAMVSLGVDFALHAVRRYKEERDGGYTPSRALVVGFAGVLGALVLAMASGGIAFLSNTSSGIESVIHFGIAAMIAVLSAFVVLGVVVPLALMRIDQMLPPTTPAVTGRARLMTLLNITGVAVIIGTGVIFLVAVTKEGGVAILLGAPIVYVLVPLLIARWRQSRKGVQPTPSQPKEASSVSRVESSFLSSVIVGMARRRILVLPVVAVLTAFAIVFAIRLDATFDVKDFFDNRSDFVVGLDKLDEHYGEKGGEGGVIYIKGDLTAPEALQTIDHFIDVLGDNPTVAKTSDGEAVVGSRTLIAMLRRLTTNEYALGRVATVMGVQITDDDEDGLPDSQDQVRAAYAYMLTEGVPRDENTLIDDPAQVREVLYHVIEGSEEDVTTLMVGILGSREQQNVVAAQDEINDDMEILNGSPAITRVGLTGSPFTRLAQLDATTKTLTKSLPIAAVATFVLLLIAMRSLRYSIVTIIPIGLVVAWLYGLMYLTGFALNYVTATIGAVSLGVGIDYSIHMTERFREEMHRAPNKMEAIRQAANGTGIALLASAGSSIIGFAIMGFAPMPLFSAYGVLTSLMIFLAMSASLAVLPSLLALVTREKAGA